jgi:UDP-N-acetyl-D-galactosamine dehydrogenase
MNINTYEVLEAAGTKWNFLKFYPGLVGGHCIGVDPYYLTYKAKELGYHAQIINAGRFVNDSMGRYVAKQLIKKLIAKDKNPKEVKILIMGITFKENVSDIRNSKVVDVFDELKSFGVENIHVIDPYASSEELKEEYGIKLTNRIEGPYDSIVAAVSHDEYMNWNTENFKEISGKDTVFVDIKGIFKEKVIDFDYWSL